MAHKSEAQVSRYHACRAQVERMAHSAVLAVLLLQLPLQEGLEGHRRRRCMLAERRLRSRADVRAGHLDHEIPMDAH